ARSRLYGGDSVSITNRLSMEGPGRHAFLSGLHRPRPLPGMGASGRLSEHVGAGVGGLRGLERDRLVLAEYGRVHDQGTPRGGKRPAKTRPIAASRAPSAACWWKPPVSRSGWPSRAPIATT